MAKSKTGIKFPYIIYAFIASVVVIGVFLSIQLRMQNKDAERAAEFNDFVIDIQIKADNELTIMDTKFAAAQTKTQAEDVLAESERFLGSLVSELESAEEIIPYSKEFKQNGIALIDLYRSIITNEYKNEILVMKFDEGLTNEEIKEKYTEIFSASNIKLAELSLNFTTAQKDFAAVNGVRLVSEE